MASKRSLYRPAQVQENVGQRRPRKTLAQGRLIGGNVQHSMPAVSGEAPLSTSHVSSANQSRLKQDGRNGLQQGSINTSANHSVLEHSSLLHEQTGNSYFTPRKGAPSFTEHNSPKYGHPAGSLDLSDSDPDGSQLDRSSGSRSHYQKPQEVLCIDASRQTVNPDVSEVDIRIGVDRSPVKIVCHSPAAVKADLRKFIQSSEKVTVDSVPSFSVEDEANLRKAGKKSSPVVRKEKIAGSHIDPYTAVQSIPMSPPTDGERRVLHALPTNYPQPNFNESEDLDRHEHSQRDVDDDDRLSVMSEDACSLNEYVTKKTKTTTKPKPSSAHKRDLQKKPDTEKKKKGRVVASRYMQAMESKAKSSLTSRMDKTVQDRSKKSAGSRSMEAPSSARKVSRKKISSASQIERPATPDNSMASSTGGKTSTPTMDGSLFHQDLEIDASAIHPETSLISGGDTSKLPQSNVSTGSRTRSRLRPDPRDTDMLGQSMLSNISTVTSTKPKPKRDTKSLQQKLDLLRVYDLQWAFLNARARKTLQEQEKQAMAQLYGLHEQVEKLRKANAEKDQYLARLKHANMTDNLTEVQRQCLGPVVSSLPTLQKQYRSLAQALDTTRHQIATKDIYLPENEDQFQSMLESQLLESEQLLADISVMTREHTPNVTSTANSLVAMEQAVESMEEELRKNRELLAATGSLTMHECSLRVQELQVHDRS